MKEQRRVEKFMQDHGMKGKPEFRILDLLAEAGEIAGDAAKSSEYGLKRENIEVSEDEIGDTLFSLLAVCNSLDIDADEALETSLEKYRERIEETGDAGSR